MKDADDGDSLLRESSIDGDEHYSPSHSHEQRLSSISLHILVLYIANATLVATLVWSLNRRSDPSLGIYCEW